MRLTLAGRLRVALVLAVLVPVVLVLIPVQWLAVRIDLGVAKRIPLILHRLMIRLVGAHVAVIGDPSASRPLLLCANHVSWLDISVLGSLFPLSFIAKAEVGQWPVFGLFARLSRTIFVDRTRRSATADTNAEIADRLKSGDTLVLFAEGTSSDGNRVLPFRASLLGGARNAMTGAAREVLIQPVAIAYRGYRGLPMGRDRRPLYCWYGDMELVPHLLGVLADGAIDIEVHFGRPVAVDGAFERKRMARELEGACRAMLVEALTGRTPTAIASGAPETAASLVTQPT